MKLGKSIRSPQAFNRIYMTRTEREDNGKKGRWVIYENGEEAGEMTLPGPEPKSLSLTIRG